MTSTTARILHDFEGQPVDRATVKVTKCGDGLSDALAIEPEEIELGEPRFFLVKTTCGRVSVETDRKGITSRVHTMITDAIAKVDAETATAMLQASAADLAKKKRELDGQLSFEAEEAAAEREAQDETGTPAEIADSAKVRFSGAKKDES